MQIYVALVNQISTEKKISFFLTALLSDTPYHGYIYFCFTGAK